MLRHGKGGRVALPRGEGRAHCPPGQRRHFYVENERQIGGDDGQQVLEKKRDDRFTMPHILVFSVECIDGTPVTDAGVLVTGCH